MSKGRARAVLAPALVLLGAWARTTQGAPEGASTRRELYVVPYSHLDLFWAGTREECLARGNRILSRAIAVAKQRPEYRFLVEDEVFTANFMESHVGSEEAKDFAELVREGRFEIAPKWVAIFQNLPNGEVLARNIIYGKRYARQTFGVDPQVAHLADIPGFSGQFPQILAKAGVPYMVMTRMGPVDKSLFHWKSLDGSIVLVWNAIKGYGWGQAVGLHTDMSDSQKEKLRKDVDEVAATTPGPIFMTWGTDLWAPSEKVIDTLSVLNGEYRDVEFRLGTPADFFRRAAQLPGLPEVEGEIPHGWPHAVTAFLHMWQLAVPATATLSTAEAFAAINDALGYAPYPAAQLDFLWKKLIESMDHNHDGQGGAIGDDRKMEYSQLAIMEGGEILRDRLRNIAERVRVPFARSVPIVVFNPAGWSRDDVVRSHVTLYGDVAAGDIADYKQGMRLVDEAGVPLPFHVEQQSENVSRALEMVFVARGVPSLGYKTYSLVPAPAPAEFPATSRIELDRDNDVKDPRRPLGADVLENDFYRVTVDKATGRVSVFDRELGRDVAKDMEVVAREERGGNTISPERMTARLVVNAVSQTEVEENNAVRTVARIVGQVADVPIVQRVTLYKNLRRIDVENTVDWKGPRFVQLEQRFPLPRGAQVEYGVPFGAQGLQDVLPGSGPRFRDEVQKEVWDTYRHVQDWVFAAMPQWGLTVTADHQLVRIEEDLVSAEMIRGLRYTSAKVTREQEVGSLTYPPVGRYVFRYSLSSGAGDWRRNRAYQAGVNANRPLIPVVVEDEIAAKSLPPTHSFCSVSADDLVLSAVKKAYGDASLVLRFYEVEGKPARTTVTWLGRRHGMREVNLLEEATGRTDTAELSVSPYEIKTVKLVPARLRSER